MFLLFVSWLPIRAQLRQQRSTRLASSQASASSLAATSIPAPLYQKISKKRKIFRVYCSSTSMHFSICSTTSDTYLRLGWMSLTKLLLTKFTQFCRRWGFATNTKFIIIWQAWVFPLSSWLDRFQFLRWTASPNNLAYQDQMTWATSN